MIRRGTNVLPLIVWEPDSQPCGNSGTSPWEQRYRPLGTAVPATGSSRYRTEYFPQEESFSTKSLVIRNKSNKFAVEYKRK